jgi:hypothetical protein
MNGRRRPAHGSFVWRAAIAFAVGIALYIVGCAVGCTAGCARDVPLGVDPRSDAAANDGGIDADAGD